MLDKKTGGPAFGQVVELRCVHVDPFGATDWEPEAMLHGGLTVRDYFAAKAIQGFCANPAIFAQNDRRGWGLVNATDSQLADYAFQIADEMIGARPAGQGSGVGE